MNTQFVNLRHLIQISCRTVCAFINVALQILFSLLVSTFCIIIYLSSNTLTQLTMEIKRIGMQQMDGSMCTTFRKLQKETEGVLPDLIGVLLLARRYKVSVCDLMMIIMRTPLQIVTFTGSTLVEGRDDGALITLYRDISR